MLPVIVKWAKDGVPPSQIGARLRDEYGVPTLKSFFGKSLMDILKEHDVKPEIPNDLTELIEKAGDLQAHLKTHRGDRKNVRSLELIEARIHRLAKYYKRQGSLPSDWKYKTLVAQLL
jgi:small subunit ribosomal protein S15